MGASTTTLTVSRHQNFLLTYDVRYLSSPIHVSAGLEGRVESSCWRILAGAYENQQKGKDRKTAGRHGN